MFELNKKPESLLTSAYLLVFLVFFHAFFFANPPFAAGQDLQDALAEANPSQASPLINSDNFDNIDEIMRMNQIQAVGTHNSYHLAPDPRLLSRIRFFTKEVDSWQYSHPPLKIQLQEKNMRQLELDIFPDPQGGLFTDRVGNLLIGEERFTGIPQLKEPGFKVLHVPFIDFETNTYTFIEGLEEIRDWSLENSNHLPVMVLVEVKDGLPLDYVSWPLRMLIKGGKFLLRITGEPLSMPLFPGAQDLIEIEKEIYSVFSKDRIITPDDVRGEHKTLEEAVLKSGWPTLRESRGKVFFALDNECRLRDIYLEDNPSLENRIMFTSSRPGNPSAAFIKMNNPMGENEELIREYVQAGYIVRTRADANLSEGRTGDRARSEAAFNSGAQYVSTDFPRGWESYNDYAENFTDYTVTLPEADRFPARCNPVNGVLFCSEFVLKNLE